MITIFDLLAFVGAFAGLTSGSAFGFNYFGWIGAVVLAPICAFAGWHIGILPWILLLLWERKKLHRESTEDLIKGLNGKYALCPNLVLSALRGRGEDVRRFLPYLFGLLVSDDVSTRNRGWVAMRSALPEYAAMIPSYRPTLSREECLRIVGRLEETLS